MLSQKDEGWSFVAEVEEDLYCWGACVARLLQDWIVKGGMAWVVGLEVL